MNCTNPILIKNPNGLTEIHSRYIYVPCGKCLACRAAKAKEWTYRLMTEFDSWHEKACFITLTYSDENLPFVQSADAICGQNILGFVPTLRQKDFQDFMKRLRKKLSKLPVISELGISSDICCKHLAGRKTLKVFYCGEYGEATLRPHYHAILFGLSIHEAEQFVHDCWQLGHVMVGSLTVESIRYVAGYVQKKLNYSDILYSEQVPPFQGVFQRHKPWLCRASFGTDNRERLCFYVRKKNASSKVFSKKIGYKDY